MSKRTRIVLALVGCLLLGYFCLPWFVERWWTKQNPGAARDGWPPSVLQPHQKEWILYDDVASKAARSFFANAGYPDINPQEFEFTKANDRFSEGRSVVRVGCRNFRVTFDTKLGRIVEFYNPTRESWGLGNAPDRQPKYKKSDGPNLVREMARGFGIHEPLYLSEIWFKDMSQESAPNTQFACGASILDKSGQEVGQIMLDLLDGKLHRFWFLPWRIKN